MPQTGSVDRGGKRKVGVVIVVLTDSEACSSGPEALSIETTFSIPRTSSRQHRNDKIFCKALAVLLGLGKLNDADT